MSIKKFLKETEPAVKHMFAALEHYNDLNPPRKEYFKKNGCAQARKEIIKFILKKWEQLYLKLLFLKCYMAIA